MLNIEPQGWETLGSFDSLFGHTIGDPEILYQRLDEKLIGTFKEKFSGEKKADPWSKVELKVGKIINVENHPTADHLYVETIDLGEDEPRTICSGLVRFLEKEDLLGKHVMVASNLLPAELSGIKSEGMVLGVSKKKIFEVINCKTATPGTVIKRAEDDDAPKPTGIDISTFKEAALRVIEGKVCIDGEQLFAGNIEISTEVIMNGKIS